MALNRRIVTKMPDVAHIVEGAIPSLPADDYILVKTTAVGLNPTDWKHIELAHIFNCIGCGVGCDYAGIVEMVGPGVTKDFKKGDRICGPVSGS
jgi:NADPH:quinone reductase-like Zn-dependent oxidoreductase